MSLEGNEMGRFTGRTAVVTGASRGIGAALAERLAAEGADVLVVARTADQHDHLEGSLSATLDRCRRHGGGRVEAMVAYLSDEASRGAIVPRALELFDGRLDVLVNNAAAAIYQPILTYPIRRRRLTFEVNVHGPLDLIQAAAPAMVERGEGWILNVSSGTSRYERGFASSPPSDPLDLGVYGASKAALSRLTVAVAAELAGTGVRVNSVEPRGGVATEGALALAGTSLSGGNLETMEEMVEGALILCDCPADWTGGIHVTLDLLDHVGATVMTLDGSVPLPSDPAPGA